MSSPKVSVIIPVYNGAEYIEETIRSILDQTFRDFEIIVVDDASTDGTCEIINQIDHPTITCISHNYNRGATAARNTGVRASQGEIIAFLDQDDLYHQDKLHEHVTYLSQHPKVGFTYNSRFNFINNIDNITDIWLPPENVSLADLVLGFPISPSDMVLRRNWFIKVGMLDETQNYNGSEITFTGRLFLSGCKFARINRVLNYRRYYPSRVIGDLTAKCEAEISCQEKILSDPRCPDDVRSLRNQAYKNSYLIWGFTAFSQSEADLGRNFFSEAVRLVPAILEGYPCEFVDFIVFNSIKDDSIDHRRLLNFIFYELPDKINLGDDQINWALRHGDLMKGSRSVLWGREDDAGKYFSSAAAIDTKIDEIYIQKIVFNLSAIEQEFGSNVAKKLLDSLILSLKNNGINLGINQLLSSYYINRAFKNYREARYRSILGDVSKATSLNPKYLANRGIWAISVKSLLRRQIFPK